MTFWLPPLNEDIFFILKLIGIVLSFVQSAVFSGLTLGLFGLGRLNLEVKAESGDHRANKVLELRKDSHLLLATLLWGNVSVNCLLTILLDSLFSGLSAFFLSTIGITILGEILPQAYFSRRSLHVGAFFAPLVRFYQILLYPIAKPSALFLDFWLGRERSAYLEEKSFRLMLKKHMASQTSDIGEVEGVGALNFLQFDDLKIYEEGEEIDPSSIVQVKTQFGIPILPESFDSPQDEFLQDIQRSERKWIILVEEQGTPCMALDADSFLRDWIYHQRVFNPYTHCHRPLIVHNPNIHFGDLLREFCVISEHPEDDVIDRDLILYWGTNQKRIITGADILGRLLRGIVKVEKSTL